MYLENAYREAVVTYCVGIAARFHLFDSGADIGKAGG
jgi:hypothetical protein